MAWGVPARWCGRKSFRTGSACGPHGRFQAAVIAQAASGPLGPDCWPHQRPGVRRRSRPAPYPRASSEPRILRSAQLGPESARGDLIIGASPAIPAQVFSGRRSTSTVGSPRETSRHALLGSRIKNRRGHSAGGWNWCRSSRRKRLSGCSLVVRATATESSQSTAGKSGLGHEWPYAARAVCLDDDG